MSLDEFNRILEYLLVANSVYVITGGFNYHISKVSSNKLLDHMIGYTQVVNKTTHVSGSQIDHVYIMNDLLKEFHTKSFSVKRVSYKVIVLWSRWYKNCFPGRGSWSYCQEIVTQFRCYLVNIWY